MHIVRAGVDSLYLAMEGTLPVALLNALAMAKEQATQERREVAIELPGTGRHAVVSAHGVTGGYSYLFDTGPLGARVACRESSANKLDWNLFVKPAATALLSLGFQTVVRSIWEFLCNEGAHITQTSVNRIDYAIDVRADAFVLNLDRFIHHPRTKRRPVWGKCDESRPSAVLAGRRLESVTIGTMPGRQIILYDKTAEARASQSFHWFEAWQIDPAERDARVWRLELRNGRDALREQPDMRALRNLRVGLASALVRHMQQVRYTAEGDRDLNVSRRHTHPIWALAQQHVANSDLFGGNGDLPPGRLLDLTKNMKIECHKRLINGNAASLAAILDLSNETVEEQLPALVTDTVRKAIGSPGFNDSLSRARQRRDAVFGGTSA